MGFQLLPQGGAVFQVRMRHHHLFRRFVIGCPIAAMPGGRRGFLLRRRFGPAGRRFRGCFVRRRFLQYVFGLFRRSRKLRKAQQQLAQLANRCFFVRHQAGQITERLQGRFQLAVLLFAQRRPRPLEQTQQFFAFDFDGLHACSLSRNRRTSGYTSTSFNERFAWLVLSFLPRPVVCPTAIQFAAR